MILSSGMEDKGIVSDSLSFVKDQWGVLPRLSESSEGALSSLAHCTSIALAVFGVILLFVVLGSVSRYVTRYLYHKARMSYLGGMVWSEIIYEGRASESESLNADALAKNMSNIMPSMPSRNFPFYGNRPLTSIIIKSDADDESVHMFVGMSYKHYSPSVIESWATGMGCSVEGVDFDEIGFVPGAPCIAHRDDFSASMFTDMPTNGTVGSVISRIQNSTSDRGGSVVVTFEPMRKSEVKLTKDHINDENIKSGGFSSQLNGAARAFEYFSGRGPSRGVIASFSDDGDYEVSQTLMTTTLSNVPNLGATTSPSTPATGIRVAGFTALFLSVIMVFLSFLSGLSLWLPAVSFIVGLTAIIGLPAMSSSWLSLSSRSGVVPVPTFWRYSLRRLMKQWWLRISPFTQRAGDSSEAQQASYTSEPSVREVIPLYYSSMMQIATFPSRGSSITNIASSSIPQVPMQSIIPTLTRESVNDDSALYLGISAKTYSPVYLTFDDLNYGMAFAGDAGSGKTNALQVQYLGMSYLSRNMRGRAGDARITPIWFETKADDIKELVNLVKPYDPLYVKVHDKNSPARLSLEGMRYSDDGATVDDIKKGVNTLVSMMEAIWGDSLGPQSKQVASSSLTIAMLLSEEALKRLHLHDKVKNPSRPNIVALMNLLIGADTALNMEESLKQLNNDFKEGLGKKGAKEKYESQGKLDYVLTIISAMDQLINLYNKKDALAPLRNKLPQLLVSDGMFETVDEHGNPRDEYGLDKFINYGGPVVLDLTISGATLAEDSARVYTMGIHYLMWQWILSHASGWASKKIFTPLFVDELKNFVGDKERDKGNRCVTIVDDVRDQGRSFGVSHNLGYQTITQLPDTAASAVQRFAHNVYLKLRGETDQKAALSRAGENSRFTAENIKFFPQGIGIADIQIAQESRRPFIIKFPSAHEYGIALSNYNSISDAVDSIHREQVAQMKRERRRPTKKENSGFRREDTDVPLRNDDDGDAHILQWSN